MQLRLTEHFLARPLRWLLQNHVSYWHNKLYRFSYQAGSYTLQQSDVEANTPNRLIILGRSHYQEFVQQYPVTRLTELKQVLRTEFQQHRNVLHYIGPEQEQRRTVCTLVISADISTQLSHAGLLIPETLLLWHYAKPSSDSVQPVVLQREGEAGYFLYCHGQTPLSQRVGTFCKDFQSFTLNNGIADTVKCQLLSDGAHANMLAKALLGALPVLHRFGLLYRPEQARLQLPLKPMATSAGAVFCLYLLLVSAYYPLAINSQQQQVARLGDEVNNLLTTQQQIDSTFSAADTLSQLRSDKRYSAHIWQLLLPLIEQDGSLALQNIATNNDRIVLRGQAKQATSVLTALQSSPLVDDVRFDASIRRQRDKEVFVISLALTQQPPAESAQITAEVVNASE